MTCFSIQKFPLFCVFALALMMLAAPLAAEDKLNPDGSKMTEEEILASERIDAPIVVELFTATDCSACILADRLLYDAMKDKNVIALSCHMQDLSDTGETGKIEERGEEAGSAKADGPLDPCVFRQWTYKSSGRRSDVSINIPEFIINGKNDIDVNSMPLFARTLEMFHYSSRNKTLEVFTQWKDKNTITISLPQAPETRFGQATASVWLVRYKDIAVERIDSGVNKGKVLRFSNIIQDIRHVGKWRGNIRSFDVDVAPPKGGKDRGGYAVLVQETMGSNMLAAGKLADYPMPNDIKHKPAPETAAPAPAPKTP